MEPQWSRQGQEILESQSWSVGLGEAANSPAETMESQISRLERRRSRVVSWRQRQRKLQQSAKRKGFSFPLEVRQLFIKPLRGATRADWSCLANFQSMTDAARAYDFPSSSISSGIVRLIPWPMVWVLHRYHPKHIWCSSQVPDPADVAITLRKFEKFFEVEMGASR